MENIIPKWIKEIERFLTIKSQFILWGNVYDVYPMEMGKNVVTFKMNDYITNVLKNEGYTLIISYEPLFGFSVIGGDPAYLKEITGENVPKDKPLNVTLKRAAEIIEMISSNQKYYSAVILNFSSRLPDIAQNDINEFYFKMFRLAQTATPKLIIKTEPNQTPAAEAVPSTKPDKMEYPKFNLTFWTIDKENDIPAWYTIDNPKVKILPVPKPDHDGRKVIIEALAKKIKGYAELDENKKKENVNLFIDQTNRLFAGEIVSIVSLARREEIEFTEIGEAIKRYKLGIVENPWSKLDIDKIGNAEEIIAKRVKGQKQSVMKSADIIKRSIYNLSGAQYSKHSQRPKGVLFFAGPTGVGKTELAKAVTELIFGSESSYIRFDMSEFAKEQADQRLVGAPPGYVGYDVGGELTNSVKQNPFAVILFDEIEKANPKILDIFLQILDDGRLTSGRGETVYFSEALIVFTSNLGMFEILPSGEKVQRIKPDMEYAEIEKKIKEAIEDFFKFKIGRPEILNRIGENVVVFDFIRADVAKQIFDKMYKSVVEKLEDSYDIIIEAGAETIDKLEQFCSADLTMGGRGIGNKLEECFVNPLSRALFAVRAKENEKFVIKDVVNEGGIWSVVLEK